MAVKRVGAKQKKKRELELRGFPPKLLSRLAVDLSQQRPWGLTSPEGGQEGRVRVPPHKRREDDVRGVFLSSPWIETAPDEDDPLGLRRS